MSAICGVVDLGGRPVDAADVETMLDTLGPLGTERREAWSGTAGRLGAAVGAVLRRRVPEDVHDRQPVVSDDGSLVLVCDAVLDNRDDLMARLGVAGRDVADSHLVLAAYQRWGRECPARLIGDFAFAVVDRRRGGVFLARDHLGIRPLHLRVGAGVVAFASTSLALGRELNEQRLVEYLALLTVSTDTWIAGVEPVGAAESVWVDTDGTHRHCYWTLDTDRIDAYGSMQHHADALREALDAAIRSRLRTTGGVGVLLSGGLDSPSVAASAALLRAPDTVHTYTAVPAPGWTGDPAGNWDPDERELVLDLAAAYPGIRPAFVHTAGRSFFAAWDVRFAAGASPPRNVCNMTWCHAAYEKARADGVTAMLTGVGGNCFYSADDPRWLVALARRGRLVEAVRELTSWAAAQRVRPWSVLRASVLAEVTKPRAYVARRNAAAAEAWFVASALRPERRGDVDVTTSTAFMDERRGRAMRDRAMRVLHGRGAQAEMFAVEDALWGMRLSDVTTDVRLLQVAAAQPAWVRRRRGFNRAVCRVAMEGRLPDSIRLRKRRGMQLPDWLDRMAETRRELADEIAATRAHPLLGALIDTDRLDAALGDWPAGGRGDRRTIEWTYRLAMLRGLMASRYVRWLETHAKTVTSAS